MAINLVNQQQEWDRFIDASPYGLLYHKWNFLKLIEKYTGYQFLPYGIYKGEQLICVFPLFYKKIAFIKLLFSPPPQSGVPYLGLVMDKDYDHLKQDRKESHVNLVAKEIDAEIKKIAPNYFAATLVPGFNDLRPFQWLKYQVDTSYTYILDLKRELEDIWESFSSLGRQNIRKGESLQCKLVNTNDPGILTKLLTGRYQEQGLHHGVGSAYLKELLEAYPKELVLHCLYDGEEIIGATLSQEYNRYIGWLGLVKAKDEKYKYANEFAIWQFIRQAKSQGFNQFEVSGANKQSLCKYRAKFNPQLVAYYGLVKKDIFGKAAEAFYFNFIKKI
jgi:hypothetical protein